MAGRSLHESDAGVGTTGAESANRPAHRGGSGCHRQEPQGVMRPAGPASSTRRAVFHRAGAGVNPDASRSLFAVGDSGAGVRRGRSGLGTFSGNAERPRTGIGGGRFARTAFRSRYCPGRSGCRSPPGNDNGRSGTNARCSASAAPADESWIRAQSGEILFGGPCTARFGGAASGRLWRSGPVPRLSQRPRRFSRFPPGCHSPSTFRAALSAPHR